VTASAIADLLSVEAARDATGPLPAACLVYQPVASGGSVREEGSDLRAGATLLEAGSAMTAAAITLFAGAGAEDFRVYRRPRVGVLATGDEVRGPGQPLGPAGIPDANGPGLRAQVTAAGAEAIDLGIATDDLTDVLKRLRGGIEVDADVLTIAGGVSVGPYDVVKPAMETIGQVDLWRVAVQPGKPFAFGTAPRPDGGAPILVFGLPGNPVSSAVTFELFVRPAIRRLAGRRDLMRPIDRAVIEQPVTKSHGRRAYLRVQALRDDEGAPMRDDRGRVRVRLAGGQGSHVISALAAADALAIVPEADDSLPAGSDVGLWWLDSA
jgi:molybdopterin molybdotransferase